MSYRLIESESSMRERGGMNKMHRYIKSMYAMLDEMCEYLDGDMSERMYEREDDDRMGMRRGNSRSRY